MLSRQSAAHDWREIGVRWDETQQRAVEVEIELSDPRAAQIAGSTALVPTNTRRIEIHLAYRDWQRDWRPAWTRGRMLTIDYGDTFDRLYHRRPRGTLRGYFRQQRVEGAEIYERAGNQDLTADVNFTDLMRWGEALGLRAAPLQTQREFILHWNPREAATDAAAAHLLDADGAGDAFKVLEQAAKPVS